MLSIQGESAILLFHVGQIEMLRFVSSLQWCNVQPNIGTEQEIQKTKVYGEH